MKEKKILVRVEAKLNAIILQSVFEGYQNIRRNELIIQLTIDRRYTTCNVAPGRR